MWLTQLSNSILSTSREALMEASEVLASSRRIFLIGNGGSAAIASHIAVDLRKHKKKDAYAFNDAAFLTCFANDYGFPYLFEQALKHYGAKEDDLLIAISSSGRSVDILGGMRYAKAWGLKSITLSGFDAENPLRAMGDINFYVSSHSYGIVEITHLAILHSMVQV